MRSFPVPGAPIAISDSAGSLPRWTGDGRTIVYWVGTRLMAASVRPTPGFEVVGRRSLFSRAGARTQHYDVSPDGKRIAVLVPDAAAGQAVSQPDRLVLVVNWLEEFKRKLAAK